MNGNNSIPTFLFHSLRAAALGLPFLAGCNMTDPMINDMETAYTIATQKSGDTHAERKAAVTQAVRKYFPEGMKTEDAFRLLRRLKEEGFEIGEYRHEGARVWPDGELRPYLDEATRRNLQNQYPKGLSKFTAKKQYGRHLLVVTKHAVVSFHVIDGSGEISDVEADIWLSGI